MVLTEAFQGNPRTARRATTAEAAAIAGTLAAAFFDDPVIGWAWDDADRRRQILPPVLRAHGARQPGVRRGLHE
jgi:hypothetical protein